MSNTTAPFCLSVANSTVNIDYNFLQTIIFAEYTQCKVFASHYGITEVMFKLLFNVSYIIV